MLWVLFFTAALMLVSSQAYKPWSEVSVRSKWFLAFLILALTFVAGGGMVQAVGFLLIFSIWDGSLRLTRWLKQPARWFQLALGGMVCAIGIYYSLRGCLEYDAAEWDLLRTADWNLITNVVDILWRVRLPACSNHTDPCGVVSVGFNFFMLVGVAAPIVLWKKRSQLPDGIKFLLSVSLTSIAQIFCAVVLAVLVARAHYYFIPRVFIYLIVLRTVLTVCGGYLCMLLVSDKSSRWLPKLGPKAFERFALAVVILGLSVSTYFTSRYTAQRAAMGNGLALIQHTCPPQKSSLALIDSKAPSEEYKLNFIVKFDEQLKHCGWVSADAPTFYIVPQYSADERTYGYQIKAKIEPRQSILGFFRQPLLTPPK